LPTYEKLNSPTKERFSEECSDYSDYGDDDEDPRMPSSSSSSSYYSHSHNGSRSSSYSESSATVMLASQRRPTAKQRMRRIYPYRLPTRAGRYLSLIIISSLIFMAYTLVSASNAERTRLAKGAFKKPPPPSPPAWENFPTLSRYYGGIRTLLSAEENQPEYPRRAEEVPASTGTHRERSLSSSKSFAAENPEAIFVTSPEELTECFLDAENTMRVPGIRYYDGRPKGFPDHIVGSYETLSLPEDICFDRFGRYGPYGLGYSPRQGGVGRGDVGDTEGADVVWAGGSQIDYRKVDWADAQRRCYQANAARYNPIPARAPEPHGFFIEEKPQGTPVEQKSLEDRATDSNDKGDAGSKRQGRTALVLRCWDDMEWQADEIMYVRSLISELSLASGGRYDVHLLVQVKDEGNDPIWADAASYERVIRERIPREFRGLVTLWTQTQMLALYQGVYDLYVKGPELPVHGPYRGLQMAMQHFAHIHPEYDYFWHWEMDIRYTGHYYDFFTKIENWAREQPRKGLWERNGRFYVPEVHGSWDEFKHLAKVQTEMAPAGVPGIRGGVPKEFGPEKPIWGPERPAGENDWFEYENDPTPPTSHDQDKHVWGVGEEADLISFMPIFNPEGTTWGLSDDITGYNTTGGRPPRRAHINTASRMSRRLLTMMHRETTFKKHFAFPEMWPATVALQHGYKAVYAPHPSFVDRDWSPDFFAQVLNGGRNGASGGSRTSVFGNREHNLHGLSWFYRSDFAPELYRAWLGFKTRYGGGADFELGGEGRMCLPPMLLHPIKNVGMVVEAPPEEEMAILEGAGEEAEFDAGS